MLHLCAKLHENGENGKMPDDMAIIRQTGKKSLPLFQMLLKSTLTILYWYHKNDFCKWWKTAHEYIKLQFSFQAHHDRLFAQHTDSLASIVKVVFDGSGPCLYLILRTVESSSKGKKKINHRANTYFSEFHRRAVETHNQHAPQKLAKNWELFHTLLQARLKRFSGRKFLFSSCSQKHSR